MNPLFFEKVLLKFLLTNSEICNKVFPFLEIDIFDNLQCRLLFKEIVSYNEEFNKIPTIKELKLQITTDELYETLKQIIDLDLSEYNDEFIQKKIEQFVREKKSFHELARGVELLKEGKIDDLNDVSDRIKTSISFTFDTKIGLNLFSKDGMEKMYDHLHSSTDVIPTGLIDLDNKIRGGLHKKSTTVILAQSNLGKTLIKCAIAANMILDNKKVLYITYELTEEYLGERILQNIFNINQDDLRKLSKEQFFKYFEKIKDKIQDLLIIKKYPSGSANCNHIKQLMNDLEIKSKFFADILIVDYLGIMGVAGINKNANSNDIGIAKCQQLNALCEEKNIPGLTGAQANRSGYDKSQLDPTNIADAIGIFAEAYLVIAVTQTEEQRNLPLPLYSWQILKNRFGLNKGRLNIAVDYNKMRLSNVDEASQQQDQETIKNAVNSASDDVAQGILNRKKDRTKEIMFY